MPGLVIASTNPVKVAAATNGFCRMFPDQLIEAQSITVESGVNAQPQSDDDTPAIGYKPTAIRSKPASRAFQPLPSISNRWQALAQPCLTL